MCALELSVPAADKQNRCFVSSQNVWKGIPVSGHQETGGWPQSKSLMGQAAAVGEEGLKREETDRQRPTSSDTQKQRKRSVFRGQRMLHRAGPSANSAATDLAPRP